MTFEDLGPLLKEERTSATCHICSNYIYKRTYYDENSKDNRKTVFVCKNCLEKRGSKY